MAINIIKQGNGVANSLYKEYMVDAESDLANIDVDTIGVGSVAYTCSTGGVAMEKMWMWNGQAWVSL